MAQWIGSPNYSVGRGGKGIEFIVCHWIVGDVPAADAVFTKASSQTSAHYAVGDGVVHQYVIEPNTAWHAGNFDINQRSIGIEHRGGPNLPISDATYETSANLIADICRRYGKRFPLRAHREFYATACPGTLNLIRLGEMVDAKLRGEEKMTPDQERALYVNVLGREPEPGAPLGQRTAYAWINDAIPEITAQRKELQEQVKVLTKKVADLEKAQGGAISDETKNQIAETNNLVKQIWNKITNIFK